MNAGVKSGGKAKGRAINVAAKMRHHTQPYASWTDTRTGWKYQLLKSWQAKNDKPYARWFCRVEGWGTDMGDVYVAEVRGGLPLPSRGRITIDESIWDSTEAFVAWAYGEE